MQTKSLLEESTDNRELFVKDTKISANEVKNLDSVSQADSLPQNYGKIHLICGPMFSGKTTLLLQTLQKNMQSSKPKKFLVISHENDNRYSSDGIATHDGHHKIYHRHPYTDRYNHIRQSVKAIKCKSLKDIAPLCSECDVIIIDEAQFFLEVAFIINSQL